MKTQMALLTLAAVLCAWAGRTEALEEQCPCIKAARAADIPNEKLDELSKKVDIMVADIQELFKKDEVKKVNAELEAAEKAKDTKKSAELEAKLKKLVTPALEKFHKSVKELLGADLYAKYNAILPDEFKL
ncbi:MAG: hypothetical protein HY291_18045 [Planctomycetes bacterium]|nr:hypothetical protein [Planctomycetota bacterium]